jgi:hypothetical protein
MTDREPVQGGLSRRSASLLAAMGMSFHLVSGDVSGPQCGLVHRTIAAKMQLKAAR